MIEIHTNGEEQLEIPPNSQMLLFYEELKKKISNDFEN